MRFSVMLILSVFAGLGLGCQSRPYHSHLRPAWDLSKTIRSSGAFGVLRTTEVLACSNQDDLIGGLGRVSPQAWPVETFVAEPGPNTAILWVHGMACPQCANNINLQLLKVPGVKSVRIDMGSGRVREAFGGESADGSAARPRDWADRLHAEED